MLLGWSRTWSKQFLRLSFCSSWNLIIWKKTYSSKQQLLTPHSWEGDLQQEGGTWERNMDIFFSSFCWFLLSLSLVQAPMESPPSLSMTQRRSSGGYSGEGRELTNGNEGKRMMRVKHERKIGKHLPVGDWAPDLLQNHFWILGSRSSHRSPLCLALHPWEKNT